MTLPIRIRHSLENGSKHNCKSLPRGPKTQGSLKYRLQFSECLFPADVPGACDPNRVNTVEVVHRACWFYAVCGTPVIVHCSRLQRDRPNAPTSVTGFELPT
eukprot:917782-Amphidinium_carterae.1